MGYTLHDKNTIVREFTTKALPRGIGLEGVFRGRNLKIDPAFTSFIASGRDEAPIAAFSGVIHRPDDRSNYDIQDYYSTKELVPNAALQLLGYLDSVGANILEIPAGEDEINIILGYANGVCYYVEHEFEDGVDEIHLHARAVSREWGDDKPFIFIF